MTAWEYLGLSELRNDKGGVVNFDIEECFLDGGRVGNRYYGAGGQSRHHTRSLCYSPSLSQGMYLLFVLSLSVCKC